MIKIVNENKVQLDTKVPNLRDENEKHIILTVCDTENSLVNLLECIKSAAGIGHSFNVIVDPGDEREQSFFIDGDGTDKIYDITINEYKDKE